MFDSMEMFKNLLFSHRAYSVAALFGFIILVVAVISEIIRKNKEGDTTRDTTNTPTFTWYLLLAGTSLLIGGGIMYYLSVSWNVE